MKKYVVLIAFILAGFPGAALADPLSLDAVLKQAQDKNPEILTARAAWQAKQADVRPAGTWENPTFSYINERFPSGISGVDPQEIQHYRLEQTIPFPGKLTGEARMKYHESLIAEADYHAKAIDVLKDTRMRYYQLYLAEQQIALADRSVEILKNALRTAQSRLASSQSSALDVFMVQTELAKAENAAYEMKQQRKLVAYELNALLNQDSETELGQASPPALVDLPVSLDDFKMLARHSDPLYLSSLHEINHAQAMLRHHRLDFAPDFGVMAEKSTSGHGPDGRMLGVSISFPLWVQRPWNELQGAKAHLTEAEAESAATQNIVMKEVSTEYIETDTRLTVARNYATRILPSAGSALKIAQERYASGADDFMRLLEAYRAWVDAQNDYQQQLYSYGDHWSALGQWLGIDVASAKEALGSMKTMPMENHHD